MSDPKIDRPYSHFKARKLIPTKQEDKATSSNTDQKLNYADSGDWNFSINKK